MCRAPRAVGLDDGPSTLARTRTSQTRGGRASIIAVWFNGLIIEHVRVGVVQVDGLDATDVILGLLSGRRADLIFLSGASFAGFNIVNARRLHSMQHIPVIIVSREKPNNASVKRALKKHFADWKIRWQLISGLGRIHAFAPKASERSLYFEAVGISAAAAKRVIRAYCVTSRVPEPIRVAGIMAKGLAVSGSELAAH